MTLQDLFIEYGTCDISTLVNKIANHIDWLSEKLWDDPWDTVAQVHLDLENKILDNLMNLDNYLNLHGTDWDIDSSIGNIIIY